MDRDATTEYVGRCQQLIESSPQMDEQNTKIKLVQPFLELLGWNLERIQAENFGVAQIASRFAGYEK